MIVGRGKHKRGSSQTDTLMNAIEVKIASVVFMRLRVGLDCGCFLFLVLHSASMKKVSAALCRLCRS